jgi:cardiolipin synthase
VRLALAVSLAVIVVLAYLLWVRGRRRNVELPVPENRDLRTLIHSIAGLTWGRVMDGNAVTVIQNSAFFDSLLDDVARAVHHVHFETFLWQDGRISDRVIESLTAHARRGVEVRVLVDQRGAKQASPRVWAALREGGVDLRVYHRARLREIAWYNRRDHRKIAVIDGRIGYTFGHGVADMWGGTPDAPTGWRDTAARLEGPAVGELQAAFLENWIKVTRRGLVGDAYFPPPERKGETPVHVAYIAPPETSSAVKRLYYLAIAAARRELILQNPYFIPDRQAVRLCADAVRRGVAVSVMLPTSETSDFPIVQHASHYSYGALLQAGARIYEYIRSGLHQKVMVVDREWCTIGSTNFDPRSFNINDEITVALYDPAIARQLVDAFQEDVRNAREWTWERWQSRTATHRLVDRLSVVARRQL